MKNLKNTKWKKETVNGGGSKSDIKTLGNKIFSDNRQHILRQKYSNLTVIGRRLVFVYFFKLFLREETTIGNN